MQVSWVGVGISVAPTPLNTNGDDITPVALSGPANQLPASAGQESKLTVQQALDSVAALHKFAKRMRSYEWRGRPSGPRAMDVQAMISSVDRGGRQAYSKCCLTRCQTTSGCNSSRFKELFTLEFISNQAKSAGLAGTLGRAWILKPPPHPSIYSQIKITRPT